MTKLDLTKPLQTRDGKKARYLGILEGKENPRLRLVFAVTGQNGNEYVAQRDENGKGTDSGSRGWDIINGPVLTSKFLNVYDDGRSACVNSFHCPPASKDYRDHYLGVIEMKYTDGVLVDAEFHKSSIG